MGEKLWYKIGEAAEAAGVLPRDIRYWESLIPEIRPRRSVGNLRYYHRDDLPKLRAIALWVKNQGFTVADCRELLLNGCVTQKLEFELDETFNPIITESEQPDSPAHDEVKIKAGKPHNIPRRPTATPQRSMPHELPTTASLQLQVIIESLQKLLSRLQKPVS